MLHARVQPRPVTLIDAQRTGPKCHDVQHPTHNRDIFHKRVHLIAHIFGIDRPEIMKDQRRGNQKKKYGQCRSARMPAYDDHESTDQFDNNRQYQ